VDQMPADICMVGPVNAVPCCMRAEAHQGGGAEAHERHLFATVLLQLSVYERRALRWGRLLQLPLVDAFFAAHALSCLTMVAADGNDMSLEVSSHICALGCTLGRAEADLVKA
jgi:hypothetical protein